MYRAIGTLILIAAIASGGAPELYAERVLPLEELLETARQGNPEIAAAKKRWDAALARVPQARSLDNPSVGVSVMKIPKGTLKLGSTMGDDRMLSVSQMFPFFGKLPLKGKIALVESQMAAAEYRDKELEIVSAVKNAYFDLFMNQKEQALKARSLTVLEGIARAAEAKYSVGEITQEGLFKINLEIARLSNDVDNLKSEESAKKTRLNALLNRPPERPMGFADVREGALLYPDINELYRLTIQNHPELQVFSYAIERNQHAKSLAQKSFLPDVMAGVALRGLTSGAGVGPWDLMLSLSVPFWFWTKQRYEVREAIANLDQARAAYAAMKNKALAQTKELASRVEIAGRRIRLYKTSLIPLTESSAEASLAAFASGKGDFMMLLDNERMLIDTKMGYYRALTDYQMNLADLERTVGTDIIEEVKP